LPSGTRAQRRRVLLADLRGLVHGEDRRRRSFALTLFRIPITCDVATFFLTITATF
jgi:hypothetical protein